MPKMHCSGDLAEIPENGQICPKLITNFVPVGTRCEVKCSSGTPSMATMKCDTTGWKPSNEVTCSGSSAGLIVGLLVGGIIVVCIIAYAYARYNKIKKARAANDGKKVTSTVSRAAKIAAENDNAASGRPTPSPTSKEAPRLKVVSGEDECDLPPLRDGSSHSNPPSYNTYMAEQNGVEPPQQHERGSRQSRRSGGSGGGRRSNYYDNGGYQGYQEPGMYPSNYGHHHQPQQNASYYQEDHGYPQERYHGHRKPYDVPI